MSLLYVDTSAVIRAYFPDEADHEALRRLVLDGSRPVVSSELTRVEVTSAVTAAYRVHRIPDVARMLDQFDVDCGQNGVFTLLALNSRVCLPLAHRLIRKHPLRSLDAIHLATALTEAVSLADGDEVTLITRDRRQAHAAQACGLTVA